MIGSNNKESTDLLSLLRLFAPAVSVCVWATHNTNEQITIKFYYNFYENHTKKASHSIHICNIIQIIFD